MIFLICILAMTGAALAMFHVAAVFFLCCGIGTACGIWLGYSIATGALQARLTSIFVAATLFGYCGGALYPQVAAMLAGHDSLAYIPVPIDWLAYALVLVMLVSICLLFATSLDPPLLTQQSVVTLSFKQERFLWCCLALTAVAFRRGDLTFMGTHNDVQGKVSIFGDLMVMVVPLIAPLAAVGWSQSAGFRRLRFAVIGLAGLLAIMPLGRRDFAIDLLLCLFAAARLSGRTWRLSRARVALTAVAATCIIIGASVFFMGLRMATYVMGTRKASLSSILDVAENTTFRNLHAVEASDSEGADYRTSNLTRYLAILTRDGDSARPLYGRDAVFTLEMTVPDVVYNKLGFSKDTVRSIGSEKGLGDEHFGLGDRDQADTVATGGFMDFGLLGFFAYPLIACTVTRAFLYFAAIALNKEGQLVAVLIVLNEFLNPENGTIAYPALLRNLTIVLIAWAILYAIPNTVRRERREPVFS